MTIKRKFTNNFCIKALKPLVALIEDDWKSSKTEEERIIMLSMAKKARKMSIICVILSQGTFIFHTFGEIYFIFTARFSELANETRRLYVISYFPYDTSSSPNFELTWLSQCLATFFGTITYSGVHGFFAVLVMHICGQFAILKLQLIYIIHQIVHEYPKKDFRINYAVIIKRHQQLNRS